MGWKPVPLDQGKRMRLISRIKAKYDWSSPTSRILPFNRMEFGDFPMARRQPRGLKERAEAASASRR